MSNVPTLMCCALVLALFWTTPPTSGPTSPPIPSPAGIVVNGNISGDVTWNLTGNPYWVQGMVNITAGSTLHVLPGVRAQFDEGSYLRAYGLLDVNGTATQPVVFTWNGTCPLPAPRRTVDAVSGGSIIAHHWVVECIALSATTSGDVLLDHIVYENSPYSGIGIGQARKAFITWSRIANVSRDAIEVDNAQYGNFSFNDIRTPPRGNDGIRVGGGGPRVAIYGNLIEGFNSGIELVGNVLAPVIAGNEIRGTPTGVLLGLFGSDIGAATVQGNWIHDLDPRGGVGIWLGNGSSGATVTGNYVQRASSSGVYDDASAGNHLIADNVIIASANVSSFAAAIRLSSVSGDTVVGNVIEGNGQGIVLSGGSGHRVFHNWIQYNGVQATDTSTASAWDDGYPSGGNHWSDYAGDDLYQGPGQNIPGPDGIGDTPRPVPPNAARDRYPFYSVPAPGIPRELTAQPLGGAVRLTWRAAPMADAYYLYTAGTPTGFDFASPIRLGNATTWTDFTAPTPGPRYYVLRGHNTAMSRTGATSDTAGVWTHVFPAGPSTFSLPLAFYPWIDYGAPGWVNTTAEFVAATGATSLAYMEAGHWRTVPGDGDPNRAMRLGEGYVVVFPATTTFTFTGLPAAMIDYARWPPYALAGFDPTSSARAVTATVSGDDVALTWTQLPEIPQGNGTYQVYASTTPAGLRGYPGVDYELLATIPATPAATLSYRHVGALRASPSWFYLVVPVRAVYWRGASTYSVGVVAAALDPGYSAVGLPLQPFANGTYFAPNVSSLSGPGILGTQWFDSARGDWVARAAWMPQGTYDAPFTLIMAVQIDATSPTRIVFVGV